VNTFTAHGGKIVKQLWSPLGTSDYSSYISQIPKDVDGVFITMVGADAPKFLAAWQKLGYKGSVPLIANETTLEQSTLRGIKNDSPVGLKSFAHYAEGRQDPGTQQFVKAYQKAYGEIPSYYSCGAYTAAQWMVQALKNDNGDFSDTDKFLKAIKAVHLKDSCEGPMKLDKYGGTIADQYLRKVVKKGNNLINDVVKTYPDVSQFWHFKPSAYLKQPVYTRQYQGKDWPTSCAAYVKDCPDNLQK
jgi:branched-chain amino acid transport system substrate-binding protein